MKQPKMQFQNKHMENNYTYCLWHKANLKKDKTKTKKLTQGEYSRAVGEIKLSPLEFQQQLGERFQPNEEMQHRTNTAVV